jgi:type IV secretory pathway VirB2 component (pilin)
MMTMSSSLRGSLLTLLLAVAICALVAADEDKYDEATPLEELKAAG